MTTLAALRAQYDAFAGEYEEHAAVAPNARDDRPATLRLTGDVGYLSVLDAACGPGFVLFKLRKTRA